MKIINTIVLLILLGSSFCQAQTNFYISPDGNDNNTGTLEKPFESIQKARDVVRSINKNMTGDITINLLDGTYELDSPFKLTAEDSGTNGYNIIYQSYNCETPIISGGRKITGWVLHDTKKNIYKTVVGKTIDTRQLYVNGVRAIRARSLDATGWVENADGYDCPAEVSTWKNISNVEVVSYSYWKCHRGSIASVNGNHVVMSQPYWGYLHIQYDAPPKWIENAYELLDEEGEWYLDRTNGILFYKPRAGEDMSTAEVVIPKLETLVSGSNVSNVQFKGIIFAYATWLFPNTTNGFPCGVADALFTYPNWAFIQIPGNIEFDHCSNLLFENNTFEHLGVSGLKLNTGCKSNRIYDNTFRDISGSGIVIGSVSEYNISQIEVKDNLVENNLIRDAAVEYKGCVGVFVGITEHTVIKHNEIRNLPYTGISTGWGLTETYICGINNEIAYNRIDSVMLELLDGGAIYTSGAQPSAEVHHNYISNQFNECAALYLDGGSSNMHWHHNVVKNGFHWTIMWSLNLYNDTLDYNYYDNPAVYLNGVNTVLENNVYVTDGNWPQEAQTIMNEAGRVILTKELTNITEQPKNAERFVGEPIMLSFNVDGKTYSCQWQKDAIDIKLTDNPTAQSSYFIIPKSKMENSGIYRCKMVVEDCKSKVQGFTNPAIVTVKSKKIDTLKIENYTKELISCANTEGNFIICAASALSGFEAKYQWYKDGVELAGETKPKLDFPNFDYPISGIYKCKVTAQGFDKVLWSGDIPVYALSLPEITDQPKEVINAQIGGTYSFEVKAHYRGKVPPYYKDSFQWYKLESGNSESTALVDNGKFGGTTSSILTINGLSADDICQKGEYYIVEIISQCGSVRSNPFIISQKPEVVFSLDPKDTEVCPGTDVVLEANAIAPQGYNVTYSWKKDNAPITDNDKYNGTNTSKLQIYDTKYDDDAGYYQCEAAISSEGIYVEGVPAMLLIKAIPTAEPINGIREYTIKRGNDASFKVDFKWGAEPVTIKWTFNGELIQEGVWDKFNGDKLLTLMLESINENQAGEYICLLENECAKTEVKFKLTVTKWDEAGISDVVSENGYSLFTAVPNPTNEIATVKYIMPKAGSVKFTLSDLSGRVIRNLFEDFAAEGMNQLQINVKQLGLPAGVYFYTMTSDNFSAVRSFVVE